MGHLNLRDGHPASDLGCGYGWATHQSNVRDIRDLNRLPRESGWSVAQAAEADQPSDFVHVLAEIDEIKAQVAAEGGETDSALPLRIAIVSLWNLERRDLDHANRCGAAWAVIPTGMVAHGWTFRNNKARVVIYNAAFDFFDRYNHRSTLVGLLGSCFVVDDRAFRQRVRFRALLDRREHEQILRRELQYRERPVKAAPDAGVGGNAPKSQRVLRRGSDAR